MMKTAQKEQIKTQIQKKNNNKKLKNELNRTKTDHSTEKSLAYKPHAMEAALIPPSLLGSAFSPLQFTNSSFPLLISSS